MKNNKNNVHHISIEKPKISKEASEAIERLRKHIDSLPEERRPKVCISSIAYNQEAFIAQTLEGFVMQQTDFPFVAVVHDDASTDGTADIIRQYAEKYPDIIFPIFERENQYRKSGGPLTLIMHYAQEATRAPYIAKCEGDDYWTSPKKLQMQADFLDKNPEYVMCSTSCTWRNEADGSESKPMDPIERDYAWTWIFESRPWPMQTLTIMYRLSAFDIEEFMKYKIRIDAVFFWYILHNGMGHKLKEDTAVYREYMGGAWSGLSDKQKWDFDYKFRKCIVDVDQSKESADLLYETLPHHLIGRSFVLTQRYKEFVTIYQLLIRFYGLKKASKKILTYLLSRKTCPKSPR